MSIFNKIKSKVTTSPVMKASKPITMNFSDAIGEIVNGNKITRVEWNDPEEYFLLKDEYLSVHHKNGQVSRLLVREADLVATDWVILQGIK